MISLSKYLRPGRPEKERKEREKELTQLQHEINQTIQAVQSGNRILQSMAGVVELNRRSKTR
jgi:hypothetical protein